MAKRFQSSEIKFFLSNGHLEWRRNRLQRAGTSHKYIKHIDGSWNCAGFYRRLFRDGKHILGRCIAVSALYHAANRILI